jgi:chromosomal replication initiator protein
MLNKKNAWQRITSSLEDDISESEFKTWFSDTILRQLEPNLAVIEVPNKFVASWLCDNYIGQIQNSFKNNLNILPEIRFTFGMPSATKDTSDCSYEASKEPAYNTDHALNASWTFDSFIIAGSNRFAYTCALAVAKKPAHHYNPLYLFSNLSLGKTHLLNAIGNHIHQNNKSFRVKYITADRFVSSFVLFSKKGKLPEFRDDYRNTDFFLLDDIHLLAGRDKSQQEFISLFNLFYEAKKQIVVAGNKPPSQIKNLIPQLTSRLEWGLLSEIKVPDQNTKMKIIKKMSKKANLYVPDDVTFFLANATNNLKTITQHLVSLETYTSLYKHEIDMSTVKSVIKNRQYHKITVGDIQKLTTGYFNISLSDLLSNKKTRKFSYPRQVAMYLTRKLTDLSFKEIGKVFGNKDHSTVIYAVKRIERDKDVNKAVLDDIDKIQNYLS